VAALVRVGDVGGDSECFGPESGGLANDFFQSLGIARCYHDVGAVSGEAQSSGPANAGGSAGDQNHLGVQGMHGGIL
jgi:hypothetical protein